MCYLKFRQDVQSYMVIRSKLLLIPFFSGRYHVFYYITKVVKRGVVFMAYLRIFLQWHCSGHMVIKRYAKWPAAGA